MLLMFQMCVEQISMLCCMKLWNACARARFLNSFVLLILSMASSKSFIKMNSQTDTVAAERRFDRNDSLKGSQISDIMSDDNLGPLRNITYASLRIY